MEYRSVYRPLFPARSRARVIPRATPRTFLDRLNYIRDAESARERARLNALRRRYYMNLSAPAASPKKKKKSRKRRSKRRSKSKKRRSILS